MSQLAKIALILYFSVNMFTMGAERLDIECGVIRIVAPEVGTGVQRRCEVAHGSGVYLAVWQDGAENADLDADSGTDIYCARVAPDGTPLDPKGILICRAKDSQRRPKVSFGGGVFLVVWEDFRNGTDGDIYASRVTSDGKVLDPDGFPVAAIKGRNQVYCTIASSGTDFLVGWMDYWTYPTYGISFSRVSSGGQVSPKDGALLIKEDDKEIKNTGELARNSKSLYVPWIKGNVGTAGFPDLIFSDGKYLCLFNDFIGVSGPKIFKLSTSGDVKIEDDNKRLTPNFRQGIGFEQSFVAGPQKSWMFFVAMNIGRGQDSRHLWHLTVSSSGAFPIADGNGDQSTQLKGDADSDGRGLLDINCAGVFDGKQYWIALEVNQGIALGRIDLDGKLLGFAPEGDREGDQLLIAKSDWCERPSLASDGKGMVLAVWTDDEGVDNCRLKCRVFNGK